MAMSAARQNSLRLVKVQGTQAAHTGKNVVMSYGWACLLSLLLLADADVPRINNLRAPANETPTFVRGEEVEIFSGAVDAQNPATPQPAADKATTLNRSEERRVGKE